MATIGFEEELWANYDKLRNNMDTYRCNLLYLGKIYERIGELDKALEIYLKVCYYGLNGASNSYIRFDKEDIFLATAAIYWVNKIDKKFKVNELEIIPFYDSV